ncbi:MAG: glycosyltransferase [Bacteroidales bacterium]|nr:glycosyltransferase [Bacteroidales bacterium]
MPKFLINTFTFWEEPPRARHQVTFALAKKYPVTFISANKFGIPRLKSSIIHEKLTVITPYFPIINKIRYRLPIINELYQHWLFKQLVKKYKNYEVINFDYTATVIYKYFTNVIYYCNDSFVAISNHINPSFIAKYHKKCESTVAQKAKFCVAVSSILQEKLLRYNPNSIEIPLGSPDINELKIPLNYKPIKNKVINVGLVCFMNIHIISYNILNLLLKDEDISLTIIGPIEEKFLSYIERRDKLVLKGPLIGEQLYYAINTFDVTIAPYSARLSSDMNSGVGTGSKMYQYFALGKPVVISYMAGLTKLNLPDKFLYVANSEDSFASLVHKAYKENSEELIIQRANYAKNSTWEKRMEKLIDYYNTYNYNLQHLF